MEQMLVPRPPGSALAIAMAQLLRADSQCCLLVSTRIYLSTISLLSSMEDNCTLISSRKVL